MELAPANVAEQPRDVAQEAAETIARLKPPDVPAEQFIEDVVNTLSAKADSFFEHPAYW